MFNFAKASVAALALAVTAGAASAATVTIGDSDIDATDGLAVMEFDSSLGTLLFVSWEGDLTASTTLVTNPAGGFGFATASAGLAVVANGSLEDSASSNNTQFILDGSNVQTTAALGGGLDCSVDDCSSFLGTGADDIIGSFSASDSVSGGSLFISYTYDDGMAPVPLPAGGALLLGGLGALAIARRKKS